MWIPGAGVFAGLALGAALISLVQALNWPGFLEPTAFFLGWSITLLSLFIVLRRTRLFLERLGATCPSCGTALIESRGLNPTARAEMAISGGRCPACGETILQG